MNNKDGSPEAVHFTGYSWRRKRHEGDKGGVDGIYLAFHYRCLSDFLFEHMVTPPPPLPPLKKLRVGEATHPLRN
jgi:hypothetical protein